MKIWKILKGFVNVVVVIAVLGFLFVVCLQRFTNNRMSFFNYRLFTVVSGSMEPKYKVGDVLIAKEKDPKDVKVGDSISYLGSIGQFQNKVITHEVVKIEKDKDGKYLFHTKGISNLVEDPLVSEDQYYGVVIYKCVILSFIYRIVGTPIGMLLFIIVPIFYIIGSEVIATFLEKEEEKRKKAK